MFVVPRWTLLTVIAAVLLAALAGCGSSGQAPADPARTPAVRIERTEGRQVDMAVTSKAVGRDVQVRLLLPPGYEQEPDRVWPVLYLLHGCCDSYDSWTRSTDVEALSRDDDVLVVMPDGDPVGFYSNWVRGPAWERFHLGELRTVLESRFHAGDRRAIAGLSMGGLGAMVYAAREPQLFRAAAAFSGLLHPRLSPATSEGILGLVASQREEPLDLWGDPIQDADRWAAHDPYELASHLRGRILFVSAGDGNPGPLESLETPPDQIEPGVRRQAKAFVRRLARLDIPVNADLYGHGTHSWPYWERELHRSWPILMRAIGVAARSP